MNELNQNWLRRLSQLFRRAPKQNELQLNREHYTRLSQKLSDHQESFKSLALDLGYRWPDDIDRQCELLIILAKRAAYWRDAAATEQLQVMRETLYQRMAQRCGAISKKLKNCRKALAQFKTAQFAALRELEVELNNRHNDIARREKELAARIAENAALPEKSEKV